MDKNVCCFVGRIGSAIKKKTSRTGNPYVWFLVEIGARENATSTTHNQYQLINVMCFKKQVIDYFDKVKAHTGNMVVIFGFVSSVGVESKRGKSLVSNAVNANEIYIVKTRPYDSERKE